MQPGGQVREGQGARPGVEIVMGWWWVVGQCKSRRNAARAESHSRQRLQQDPQRAGRSVEVGQGRAGQAVHKRGAVPESKLAPRRLCRQSGQPAGPDVFSSRAARSLVVRGRVLAGQLGVVLAAGLGLAIKVLRNLLPPQLLLAKGLRGGGAGSGRSDAAMGAAGKAASRRAARRRSCCLAACLWAPPLPRRAASAPPITRHQRPALTALRASSSSTSF